MADVARTAGVSNQTVSRVLHGSPSVRDETRERVLAAVRRLDYRPNVLARALVTGHSRTLGVVFCDALLFGPAASLVGVEQAAADAGYVVSVVGLKSLTGDSVVGALERLQGQRVEGIVLISPRASIAQALTQTPTTVPLVMLGAWQHKLAPSVEVDQVAGARMATEHLLGLGHATVWHISGPPDWTETPRRIEGWRAALTAAGADVPAPLVGDWGAPAGYSAGRRLAADPAVTAIFTTNDHVALGLLRALHEAGRNVPGDVSVVGYDDIPEAAYFTPPLTTVNQDFGEVGRRGLALLLEAIEGGERRTELEQVPPTLVVRGSTAEARA
jgi:DNA-binding LacI/PurR family transcriptional regulator